MKKILICGPTQCGSTRVFNLVRLLFEKNNIKVASKWIHKPSPDTPHDVLIVKCHDIVPENLKNYECIILPLRDPRDASISHAKRFLNENQQTNLNCYIEFMVQYIHLYRKFKPHAGMVFKYEDYGIESIQRLADTVKVETNEAMIQDIMKELDDLHNSKDIVKKDNHSDENYAKTLMSQHHNTSGGQSQKYLSHFTNSQNETILKNNFILTFLKNNNYYNES